MTKKEIIQNLQANHQDFIDLVLSLNEKDFLLQVNDKWNAGQQLQHICLSVSPLAQGLRLPVFLLKLFFGKANRPSRSFDALVHKYHEKLQQGGVASGRFVPKPVRYDQRIALTEKLLRSVKQLCSNIESLSELQLDAYILPHPLLGKLTVREMMYFTIYHVVHHRRSIIQITGKVK